MYNATYCNYHYNVVFDNHTYMMSSYVTLESPQFILGTTGKWLKNFSSQEIFLLYRKLTNNKSSCKLFIAAHTENL